MSRRKGPSNSQGPEDGVSLTGPSESHREHTTRSESKRASSLAGSMESRLPGGGSPVRFLTPLRIALIVAALALLSHLPALRNGFVFDDHYEIELNRTLRAPISFFELWRTEYWGVGSQTGWYRPVPLILQKALFDLFGLDPVPYHACVLVFHALTAGLLAWILAARFALPRAGLLLGALFAVHTVHAEAVGTAYGLKEVLAALFSMGALLVLTAPTREQSPGRLLRLIASGLLTALAILSKESAAPIPLALIAGSLYRNGPWTRLSDALRSNGRRALFDGVLLVGSAIAAVSMRYPVVGAVLSRSRVDLINNPILGLRFPDTLFLALRVLSTYLCRLVWPVPFSPSYALGAIEVPRSLLAPDVLLGLAALGALIVTAVLSYRLRPPAGVGAIWTLGTYFLASNLALHFSTLMSERFLYLPSLGLAMLLAPSAERLLSRSSSLAVPAWRAATTLGLSVLVAALGLLTWSRTAAFGDDQRLLSEAFRWYPNGVVVRLDHAMQLAEQGHGDEAQVEISSLLARVPDLPRAYERLATISLMKGDRGEALRLWQRATQDPAADVGTHLAYAELLLEDHRDDEAIRQLSEGIRKGPGSYKSLARARELRGTLLMRRDRTRQGLNDLELACLIDPESPAAWEDLATALQQQGDVAGAESALRTSIAAAPSRVEALRRLGRLLISQRRGAEAIPYLIRVLDAQPGDVSAMSDLGTAYVQARRIEEARGAFERLLTLDPHHLVALATMGSILESRGDQSAAAGYYRRYLTSNPPEDPLTSSVRARLAKLESGTMP